MKDFSIKLDLSVKAETMTEAAAMVIEIFRQKGIEVASIATTRKLEKQEISKCHGCTIENCAINCPYIGCDDYY